MRSTWVRRSFWLLQPFLLIGTTQADSGTCSCPSEVFVSDELLAGSAAGTFLEEAYGLCSTPDADACVDPCICSCGFSSIDATFVEGGFDVTCTDQTGTCVDPGAFDDPHMMGLLGQTFDWAGTDGEWYSMLSDGPDLQMNVRVTAPLPKFPDRQLLTGVSLVLDGGQHSLVIEVQHPHSMETEQGCSLTDGGGVSRPCLANGALLVTVDGQEYSAINAPATGVVLPDGNTVISALNLPAECQPFGGDKVWAENFEMMSVTPSRRFLVGGAQESLRARPKDITLEEWVLRSGTLAAPEWCAKLLEEEGVGGLLDVDAPHTVFRIDSPLVSLRVNVGTNHEDAQVLPDGREVPPSVFWQANVGVEWVEVSPYLGGMLGETSRIAVDAGGKPIMHGLDVLGGPIESYRVSGPLDANFEQPPGAY